MVEFPRPRSLAIDPNHLGLGEGIAVVGGRFDQRTWQTRTSIDRDHKTSSSLVTFAFPSEGRKSTSDGLRLIVSEDANRISSRVSVTFAQVCRVAVRNGDRAVAGRSTSAATSGPTSRRATSSPGRPATGRVTGWIHLPGLREPADRRRRRVDILNGIAHHPATGHTLSSARAGRNSPSSSWPRRNLPMTLPRGRGCRLDTLGVGPEPLLRFRYRDVHD
jgi:hypothetical protein